MKKLLNNKIFYFILGAIIFSTISVYAVTIIDSKDVSFSSKHDNWKVENVQSAIDYLYEIANNRNSLDELEFKTTVDSSQGHRLDKREISTILEAGSYIIVGNTAYTSLSGTGGSKVEELPPTIENSSGTCTLISSRQIAASPTTLNNGAYLFLIHNSGIWKCVFEETTTVKIISAVSNITNIPQLAEIHTIKLD